MNLKSYLFFSIIFLVGCSSIERLAIPKSQLLNPVFQKTNQQVGIDHSSWNDFLIHFTGKNSYGEVYVNYKDVQPEDHKKLKKYISYLSSLSIGNYSRDVQLAYWANLYNAKTVDVILDNYPVESIRDIKSSFFDLGPWDEKRLVVEGKSLSLHDIEHGIVRPVWNQTPEIHYILNCAAKGCPSLNQEAFTANNVHDKMQSAAKNYVNNRHGVHYEDGDLKVSKIYSWYIGDFGGSEASIVEHIKKYANDELLKRLEENSQIDQFFYNWMLNQKSP